MYDVNVASPFGPQTVRFGLPPASLLKFPPNELPATIPAPQISEPTWKQPFNISPTLYTQVLDVRVPVTIAAVYAVTVVILNRVNKSRGFKPYAFSQTSLFKLLVVLHNVFLAVYSAWTCAGMFLALRNSMPDAGDPHGLAGVADSFCKINGPRGYGNAAVYNTSTDQWTIGNPEFKLPGGIPDPAESGRLWNAGLAYFGWIFYLSKFYEVVDTAIILAKGKKSSTLQTYHHAGAMMCMWAGIRYMAAPIWIFALVNSGIHALMYTYYTLTSLHVRVPTAVKRSLTTMQITQFVFGSAMAASYLFVMYTLPSEKAPLPAAPAASEGLMPWLKQFAGAGTESRETGAGSGNQMVTCMDTTGQAFAIWLNVLYLLPLTYLFARFFVRSYLYRKDSAAQRPTHMQEAAEKAGLDALKGVSREIQKAVEMNGEASEATEDEASKINRKKVNGSASGGVKTRSATANQKKPAASGRAEGSAPAPAPAKKGTKKGGKEKEPVPSVPEAKGQNPFEVLDGKS